MLKSLDQKIGVRLSMARRRAGLSLDELSDMMTLPKEQIARMERGDTRLTAKLLCQLATALEIEIRWFFLDVTAKKPQHATLDCSPVRDIHHLVANARSRNLLAKIVDAKHPSGRDTCDAKAA